MGVGDAVWFEACGELREPYRRRWLEGRELGKPVRALN